MFNNTSNGEKIIALPDGVELKGNGSFINKNDVSPSVSQNAANAKWEVCPCFTAGTLIHIIHGLKPIEKIERGELVWSREECGEKYDYRPVIATKVTPNVPIYEVKVQHDNGIEETFSTTEEHPFWIDGQGWLKASILEAGMKLLDKQGNATVTVISQTALDETDTLYNFEVQDFSTYHIGELGVWVHNADCCVLQTGGRTISNRTANALNETYGTNLNRREIGRALEDLKRQEGLPADHHGKIWSNGDYTDGDGNVLGNIGDYL